MPPQRENPRQEEPVELEELPNNFVGNLVKIFRSFRTAEDSLAITANWDKQYRAWALVLREKKESKRWKDARRLIKNWNETVEGGTLEQRDAAARVLALACLNDEELDVTIAGFDLRKD